MDPAVAVHFGPGRLGLGLVVDVLLDTRRYDVYVLGRPGSRSPERRSYYLRFTDPDLGMRQRTVTWAGNPERATDLPPGLLVRLASSAPVLVTAALGGHNVEEAYERIHELVQLRPVTSPTVVLACENDAHAMYDALARANPHVTVLNCVVDRICAWDESAILPGKCILAHDVSQWVIPHAYEAGLVASHGAAGPASAEGLPAPWPPLTGLAGAAHVLMLEGDAAAYKHRKLWVVNGTHLILATIARRYGVDVLPLTGRRQRLFREAARPLMLAMLETVDRAFGLPIDEHFADQRVRAFCEAPDSATRILRDRYLRADLRPYMSRLGTRLAAAAKVASAHDVDVAPFVWAFEEVVEAVAESDSFLDVTVVDPASGKLCRRLSPPPVDAEIDAEVEQSFGRALADWAPSVSADTLTRRLHNALATWRDE